MVFLKETEGTSGTLVINNRPPKWDHITPREQCVQSNEDTKPIVTTRAGQMSVRPQYLKDYVTVFFLLTLFLIEKTMFLADCDISLMPKLYVHDKMREQGETKK